MGKTKRQHRKWRKIDTQEVEDFLEKSTREAQQGLQVDSVPDNDLFFVDTVCPGDFSYRVSLLWDCTFCTLCSIFALLSFPPRGGIHFCS